MPEVLFINSFLEKQEQEKILLLDVRSPSEYKQAHIPGAVNLPLLDDENRAIVGTTYKKEGHHAAVLKGFDLVGKKFGDFIREATLLSNNKEVMLYCWRGGMRSGIMSWVLSAGGFNATLLKGGYKVYRRWVLDTLDKEKKIVVVGGKTGSGKTEVLKHLRGKGEQVICLESLAHHKGSAFGSLGQLPQPRNEMFENLLAMEWNNMDESKVLWLENESHIIGSVMLPVKIYERIRTAPIAEINMSLEQRMDRILNEYGNFSVEELSEKTMKLKKRLGEVRTKQSIEALKEGRKEDWLNEVLIYYDKTYSYGNEIRNTENIYPVSVEENDTMQMIADKLISMKNKIYQLTV